MTSIVPFQATDLFYLNNINLDSFTENFPLTFYFQYLSEWPTLFYKSIEPSGDINDTSNICSGYLMAKTEGKKKEWHSHITAVTIDTTYRRLKLASELCLKLERYTELDPYNVYFIDLFVKTSNKLAINMYEKLGYTVYRRVIDYYNSGSENRTKKQKGKKPKTNDDFDAFDMRKALLRDIKKETIRKNGRNVFVSPEDIYF